MKPTLAFLAILISFSLGCSAVDKDDIPRSLTGFRVYLYDQEMAPNADYFAGEIQCRYSDRENGLMRARFLANDKADSLKFDTSTDRFYIICTTTKESNCVTKVR